MNRLSFGQKSSQSHTRRVDRFILPRETFVEERRRKTWRIESDTHTLNIWDINHQRQKKYKKHIDTVFGLDPVKGVNGGKPFKDAHDRPWPCAPRKNSFLSSADSILDLPHYSSAPIPELIDWGKSNLLVAALGEGFHFFSWETQDVTGSCETPSTIYCCKFSPKGDMLLLGTDGYTLLHDISTGKEEHAICWCLHPYRPCRITAVDWSPTGNSFVMGCSGGKVISFDRRHLSSGIYERGVVGLKFMESPILMAKISPDARYVAVGKFDTAHIIMCTWPYLKSYSHLEFQRIVRAVAWHPWRTALLAVAVGYQRGGGIYLANAPSSKLVACSKDLFGPYTLDTMLFSHSTGELVLSLLDSDRYVTSEVGSQLLVMKDLDTVVDQSGEEKSGPDRVRTMVFSPDGTKLATATSGEDLIIWTFLPEEKGSKNTKSKRLSANSHTHNKRFSALPAYLDEVTYGFALR